MESMTVRTILTSKIAMATWTGKNVLLENFNAKIQPKNAFVIKLYIF